ncbi:MAG: GNAT family N-acetyltransferase [Candidatus Omnitrophica bacterium]|nr:GNAT family N-acetyltransferase [Candidatus Omnitrophota bacterium]
MNLIKYLAWDSRFFGAKIGSIITSGKQVPLGQIRGALKQARKENYECLYSEIPISKVHLLKGIFENDFLLVDFKVTLRKPLQFKNIKKCSRIENVRGDAGYFRNLTGLSDQLAMYSRFSRDPRFGKIQAKRLYREWVRKSLFSNFSDYFLIYKNKHIPEAFLTIRMKKNLPFIDLIGVSREMRGKGVGGKLLSYAEQELYKKGFRQLKVVTQGANKKALSFYEHKGFRIEKTTLYFHKWLN